MGAGFPYQLWFVVNRETYGECLRLFCFIQFEKNMRRVFILLFLFAFYTNANSINIDGIYYNLNPNTQTAEVTYVSTFENSNKSAYIGDVIIPPIVSYNDVNYIVKSIGKYAFNNCTDLKSISIPNTISEIGSEAFYNCNGLGSIVIPANVEKIVGYAFWGCTNLKELKFEDGENALSWSLGDLVSTYKSLFSDCPLKSVYLGRNIDYTSEHPFGGTLKSPFYHNSLSVVEFGGSFSVLASYFFEGCSNIKTIKIPQNVTSIGSYAFYQCGRLLEVEFGTGLSSISSYAFSGCNSLSSIIIPDNVVSIGSYAFQDCPNLRSVVIGNGISRIEDYVFSGSTHLTSFTVGSNVSYISKYAFCQKYDAYYPSYSKPIKTIWLTNTPPSGYLNAEGTVNYVSNELYTSLKTKKNYPFLSSIFEVGGIKYVPVSPSEKKCDAIDCLYDASAKSITLTPNVSYRGIDMDLVEIMPYLCCNNQYIVDVQWNVVNDIPNNSFQSCKSLKDFIIKEHITSIGEYALSDCISLVDFVIPTSVKTIDGGALSGCSSLTSITIPQSVTTINNNVFNGCTSINSVIIQDRDIPLEIGASFNSCPLDTVFIGGIISSNYSPFAQNATLRSVAIADKETNIYKKEFYNCTNLQNVWIGDGVTTIDEWAFSGCKSLKFFSFGSKLNSIGKEAFSDCVAISTIISKAIIPPVCGSQALDDINKWECKLIVPKGSLELYQTSDQWKEFFFVEETSNIKSLIYGDGKYNGLNGIYNLKGQKIPYNENARQLSKGFYIINGKKVIKK